MFDTFDLVNLLTSLNFMLMNFDFNDIDEEDEFIELTRKVRSLLKSNIKGD